MIDYSYCKQTDLENEAIVNMYTVYSGNILERTLVYMELQLA